MVVPSGPEGDPAVDAVGRHEPTLVCASAIWVLAVPSAGTIVSTTPWIWLTWAGQARELLAGGDAIAGDLVDDATVVSSWVSRASTSSMVLGHDAWQLDARDGGVQPLHHVRDG